MTVCDIFCWILERLIPPFLAVIATQKLNDMRAPDIEMVLEPRNELQINYKDKPSERYYAWRVLVRNKRFEGWVAKILKRRETALNCKASIVFYDNNEKQVYSTEGRWAKSPQPSHFAYQKLEKILYPERISIRPGKVEELDIICQFPNEPVAYIWNNEAYFYDDFRNKDFIVKPSTYKVEIRIEPQNADLFVAYFKLIVSDKSDETKLLEN